MTFEKLNSVLDKAKKETEIAQTEWKTLFSNHTALTKTHNEMLKKIPDSNVIAILKKELLESKNECETLKKKMLKATEHAHDEKITALENDLEALKKKYTRGQLELAAADNCIADLKIEDEQHRLRLREHSRDMRFLTETNSELELRLKGKGAELVEQQTKYSKLKTKYSNLVNHTIAKADHSLATLPEATWDNLYVKYKETKYNWELVVRHHKSMQGEIDELSADCETLCRQLKSAYMQEDNEKHYVEQRRRATADPRLVSRKESWSELYNEPNQHDLRKKIKSRINRFSC